MSENKNDGWPDKIHLFTPIETLKKLGHLLTDQIRHTVPSEHHGNYWKEAEALHEDGATTPSVMDTFE